MNKNIIWICIVAVMLVACKAKTSESSVSEGSKITDLIVNPDALVQMDFTIEGMTCTGCENTINKGVGEIAGVIEVSSSFQDGKTIVKYDSTQTNYDKISKIIVGKGYSVTGYSVHNAEKLPAATAE